MIRFIIGILAVIGLASLFFGANAAAGAGLVLLAPIFILFKVLVFVALAGMVVAAAGRRGYRRRIWGTWDPAEWRRRFDTAPRRESGGRDRTRRDREDAERERFQQWHDLEHARREVDSWTEDDL